MVTPVGLMMGNIESARRLERAISARGIEVTTSERPVDYDILHVHTPVPPGNFRIVKKAKRRGIPVVMHAHTTVEDSVGTWSGSRALAGVTGTYLTRFYNLGDIILAPSAWTRARLERRGVSPPIRVLSNGVDLARFAFDQGRRERFRRRFGIPGDAVVAYSIGVVCLKKGIETYPEVTNAIPDIDFAWVGKLSRLYHPVRVGRAMRHCGKNTRFLHDVEDIVDAHCGGDIFFAPSFAENQGMAVMEAMAVGRPVVARDLPSYEGLLEDGKDALIGRSADDFVAAIQHLRKEPGLGSSLAEVARKTIQSHSIGQVAEQLESIYRDLLDGRAQVGGTRA